MSNLAQRQLAKSSVGSVFQLLASLNELSPSIAKVLRESGQQSEFSGRPVHVNGMPTIDLVTSITYAFTDGSADVASVVDPPQQISYKAIEATAVQRYGKENLFSNWPDTIETVDFDNMTPSHFESLLDVTRRLAGQLDSLSQEQIGAVRQQAGEVPALLMEVTDARRKLQGVAGIVIDGGSTLSEVLTDIGVRTGVFVMPPNKAEQAAIAMRSVWAAVVEVNDTANIRMDRAVAKLLDPIYDRLEPKFQAAENKMIAAGDKVAGAFKRGR